MHPDIPRAKKITQAKLDKTLAMQLMAMPGPLKEWPAKQSVQAWHLNIMLAFSTGLYASQLSMILPYGIETVLKEIKTATIERAGERFSEMRRLFHDHTHRIQLDAAIEYCVESFFATTGKKTFDEDDTITSDISLAFLSCLSHLLLTLRAIPYTHDNQVMARSEAQRLSRITRREGVSDAMFLRESTERLNNYLTLWGATIFKDLQQDLRGLLPHLVSLFADQAFIGKFMELANEYVKSYVKSNELTMDSLTTELVSHGGGRGIICTFPGAKKTTTMRMFNLPPDLSVLSDIGPIIKGLLLSKQPTPPMSLRKLHNTGQFETLGFDVVSNFLIYATEIMSQHNTIGNMIGASGQQAASSILLLCDPFENALPETSRQYFPSNVEKTSTPAGPLHETILAITPTAVSEAATNARMDRLEEWFKASKMEQLERNRTAEENARRMFRELMDHQAHGATLLRTQMEKAIPPSLQHAPPSSLPSPRPSHSHIRYTEEALPGVMFADGTRDARPPARPWTPNQQTRMRPDRNVGQNLRSQFDARQTRPARLDAKGQVIIRLLDKPPTPYEEIDEALRTHLSALGIKNEKDYSARGEENCVICGPNCDHYTNRCVKLWAGSDKGRRGMGVIRAAEKVRQALYKPQGNEINSITESLLCIEAATATSVVSPEEVEDAVIYLIDAFQLIDSDSMTCLLDAADSADYLQKLFQVGVYAIESSS